MTPEHLHIDDRDGVRTITLNRPDSLNALTYDVLDELDAAAEAAHSDPNVRVVVVRGAGRAFCAGDDLTGMGTPTTPIPDDANLRAELGYTRFVLALRRLAKPVIGQVHGYAMGAGCDLVLACDLVVAAEGTQFGLSFARRGMVGGTCLLPQLVGYQKACDLLFTGRTFDVSEAQQLGIVTAVVPAEQLDDEVRTRAAALARGPTAALGLAKRAINQSIGMPLENAVEMQRHVTASMYHTHDYEEGRAAFKQRREPDYRGR